MSPFGLAFAIGAALAFVGWIVVSFSPPGRLRATVEWLAATGLYVAIVSAVGRATLHMWERELWVVVAALGFMLLIFVGGFLVSFANTFLALRGSEDSSQHQATN